MSDKSMYDHFLEVVNISTLKSLEDTPKDELLSILNDAADAVDATNFDCDSLGDFCALRLREAADLIEMNELPDALEMLKDTEFAFDTYTSYRTFQETN